MSWPLYLQGKNLQYPLNMRLGGTQSWSGCGGEAKKKKKKIFLAPAGN